MKNIVFIKILDNEIWLFKDKTLYKEKTGQIMNNNFITNNKLLQDYLKKIFTKYRITNTIIQNKIYILINKLYCNTNIYVIKNIMYNLGISNYKLIYEEDSYKTYNEKILSYWDNNGIYINQNKEIYVDYNTNFKDIIEENTLILTANKDILQNINNKVLIYENNICPVFKIILNNIKQY